MCAVARTNAAAGPGAFAAQLLTNRLRCKDDQSSYIAKSNATRKGIGKRVLKHSTQCAFVVLLPSTVNSILSANRRNVNVCLEVTSGVKRLPHGPTA